LSCGQYSAALTCNSSLTYDIVLIDRGTLYLWGSGILGEYLKPTPLESFQKPILDVEISSSQGMLIDIENEVYAWGTNASGELGVGDTQPRSHPIHVAKLSGKHISNVYLGHEFVIAHPASFTVQKTLAA